MQLPYSFFCCFLLNLFVSLQLFAQATDDYSSDYDLKWKKYKSKEFSFKCKLPIAHEEEVSEDMFGKELQLFSEHNFLSFFVYARKHKNDLSEEDPEELGIDATYNFANAMGGDLVYMRAVKHSGINGHESRMKLEKDMQARYAVFFKGQMQYQLVMVFLSDESEKYFHKMLKKFKIR